jgi:2-polyprenyl-3-methyl-5-hydroxy-6-metoxy-1,4-benzoquinol methylase
MISDVDSERIESNHYGWNLRAPAHLESTYYDVETFKKGRSTLRALEQEELGDVRGRSLLHLQCHIGTNTLSLARMGAVITGADFSEQAIGIAQGLADELGIAARFVCSNIYDLPRVLQGQFDIAFTGYGTLCWLPDLERWARVVAHFLKPGGKVCIVEIHPIITLFTEVDGEVRLTYSLFQDSPQSREMTTSYSDRHAEQVQVPKHTLHSWPWNVGSLVTALINAGLTIERLREVPIDARQRLPMMVKDGDRRWRLPNDPLPLTLICVASKLLRPADVG